MNYRTARAVAPISLSIERITLDGPAMNPLQTRQLHGAIERELANLLRMQPLAPASSAQERVRGPMLRCSPGTTTQRIGIDIARSIHAALETPE